MLQVIFLHIPTGTLVVTDLFWNYPAKDVPFGTWLWKQGMDRIYLPFYNTFMIKNKGKKTCKPLPLIICCSLQCKAVLKS